MNILLFFPAFGVLIYKATGARGTALNLFNITAIQVKIIILLMKSLPYHQMMMRVVLAQYVIAWLSPRVNFLYGLRCVASIGHSIHHFSSRILFRTRFPVLACFLVQMDCELEVS
jgi:hypothetical protein